MKHFKKIAALVFCAVIGMSCAAGFAGCGEGAGGNGEGNAEGTVMNDTFYNPLRLESGLGDPWMYTKDGYYDLT